MPLDHVSVKQYAALDQCNMLWSQTEQIYIYSSSSCHKISLGNGGLGG